MSNVRVFKKDESREEKYLYLVVFDGYTGKYGSEMYLYGVFTSESKAQSAIDTCRYKDNLRFDIVKSKLNKINYISPTEYEDQYDNDVYIGGYIE